MQNIRILYHPADIHQHFLTRWKTDIFRVAHETAGSFLHRIMEGVARMPLFIYDMSEHPASGIALREHAEWKHFSPWWWGIIDYRFDHPGIHDTCWLHDLYHKAFMPYQPDLSFEDFAQKMIRHEQLTTIASVYEIYFHYPELRPLTYDDEILSDRFMRDEVFMATWRRDPDAARETMLTAMKDISLHPHPDDPVKQQIYEYTARNSAWLCIWKERYNKVETHMRELQHSLEAGRDKKEAMDAHMAWLMSNTASNTDIPFYEEAAAFAAVYRGEAS